MFSHEGRTTPKRIKYIIYLLIRLLPVQGQVLHSEILEGIRNLHTSTVYDMRHLVCYDELKILIFNNINGNLWGKLVPYEQSILYFYSPNDLWFHLLHNLKYFITKNNTQIYNINKDHLVTLFFVLMSTRTIKLSAALIQSVSVSFNNKANTLTDKPIAHPVHKP